MIIEVSMKSSSTELVHGAIGFAADCRPENKECSIYFANVFVKLT